MSEIKTSDIWTKGYKLTFDYCPSNTSTDETFGFIFSSIEPCIFICDVVNNHDRMMEEMAELKAALLEIKNTPDVQCDECPSIASAALAKLNQERE